MKDLTAFSPIKIPIAASDRSTAQQFARQQPTAEKSHQIYRNTLTVLAVRHYLQMLDISSDLKTSYSWDAGCRLGADIADLYLPGKGRLECRFIATGEDTCALPPEVWTERLGYIFVEIDENYLEGTILGFVSTATATISRAQLQPLDALLERLHSAPSLLPSSQFVRLNLWLHSIFEPGWQAFEEVLQNSGGEPSFAFRSRLAKGVKLDKSVSIWQPIEHLYQSQTAAVLQAEHFAPSEALSYLIQRTDDEEVRWKAAELLWAIAPENLQAGIRRVMPLTLAEIRLALMVAILPKADQSFAVLLRVYPTGNQFYLPVGLQLKLTGKDELGNPVGEKVTAESNNDYIQLKLIAELGEQFSVVVELNDTRFEEDFTI